MDESERDGIGCVIRRIDSPVCSFPRETIFPALYDACALIYSARTGRLFLANRFFRDRLARSRLAVTHGINASFRIIGKKRSFAAFRITQALATYRPLPSPLNT